MECELDQKKTVRFALWTKYGENAGVGGYASLFLSPRSRPRNLSLHVNLSFNSEIYIFYWRFFAQCYFSCLDFNLVIYLCVLLIASFLK